MLLPVNIAHTKEEKLFFENAFAWKRGAVTNGNVTVDKRNIRGMQIRFLNSRFDDSSPVDGNSLIAGRDGVTQLHDSFDVDVSHRLFGKFDTPVCQLF